MLWGTVSAEGSLSGFEASLTGRGRALPGRLDPGKATLDLAEERFRFQSAGRIAFRLLERARGWRARSTRYLLPMGTGELLIGEDAFLVLRGSLEGMAGTQGPGASQAVKRALGSPAVRTFLLVRRSDVQAWRRRGRWTELFCLATSEVLLVPTLKAVLRIRGSGASRLQTFLASFPEARDLAALDKEHELRLPAVPGMTFSFVLPLLVGLLGMFGSIGIGVAFLAPGSIAAGIAVGGGMILLVGGLIAFFAMAARAGRRARREGPHLRATLDQRSLQVFFDNTSRLAREFAETGRRREILLDSTIESLGRLPALEAQLAPEWRPTVYRYAAYLAEVFSRDIASRIHAEWTKVGGTVALRCREVGIDLNPLGYAQARLSRVETATPMAEVRSWRQVATMAQSAQPLDLFAAVSIRPDQVLRSADVLPEIAAVAIRAGATTVPRPFGTFVLYRGPVLPGLWIQYQAFLREEGGERVEEPRCLRPVFEPERTLECVVLESFELPCGGEALVVADYGGAPGQPLVLTGLATDYLAQPPGSLGPGQRRRVALGGIALGGEIVAPTPDTLSVDPAGYGSVHPANPSQPVDPRFRVVGVVADVKVLPGESRASPTSVIEVNARGLRIPILADASRVRGTPARGSAFNGEVWLELQFKTPPEDARGVDVA